MFLYLYASDTEVRQIGEKYKHCTIIVFCQNSTRKWIDRYHRAGLRPSSLPSQVDCDAPFVLKLLYLT